MAESESDRPFGLHAARSALQVFPAIAAALYTIAYAFDFTYLLSFGLSPDQVGLSELSLVIRISVFSLIGVAIGFFIASILAVIVGAGWVVVRVIRLGSRILMRGSTSAPLGTAETGKRRRTSLGRGWKLGSAWLLVLAIVCASTLLLDPENGAVGATFGTFLVGSTLAIVVLSRAVRKSGLVLTWTNYGLALALYALLLLGAFGGGSYSAGRTIDDGRVSNVARFFGIEVTQVIPHWQSAPTGYSGGRELLQIGNGGSTIFLYDCQRRATYGAAADSVLLIADVDRHDRKRLSCKGSR